jgi:signal transduction histidine kinase
MASLRRDSAVALVAFALTLLLLGAARGGSRELDAPGVVLAALSTVPLVAHRRSPLAVFAVTTIASAALNARGYAGGPPFGPTVALFFVARDDRTRARIRETGAVVLGLFALHLGGTAIAEDGFPTTPILFGVVVWGAAWTLGDQLRARARRRGEVAERLARAARDVERERRLAAAEERARIARDLHDSAAHAINVILVQAGAARLLQERDPVAARHALTTIEDVARETIGEIDLIVRGLREDPDGAVEPPTGLAALGTLAERYRAGGLAVEVQVEGAPRPLPRGVDQAAYRIVQESLTNAARHGAGGAAAVRIGYGEAGLALDVANDVEGAATPTQGGHGILGMRERAALLGGSLEAGVVDGAFRVAARLPYAVEERR